MFKEQLNERYSRLAAELGHIQFQITLLEQKQKPILLEISKLNQTMETLKQLEASNEAKNANSPQS